jgi:single-stranded DNA-specific DHH superfamily exonuclease
VIAIDEINAIILWGWKLIITVHHNPNDELPPAFAIIIPY